MNSQKSTVSRRIALHAVEKRALDELRELCYDDQEAVNSLLWSMVASLKQAKEAGLAPAVN